MHAVHETELPFRGMSRRFVGAEQGDVGVSAFLVNAPPGRGPVPHRHPYDEIAFIRAGKVRWTVDGVERDAGPGDILVVKAGEIHSFVNIGEEPLVQIDIHLGPDFVQEDFPESPAPR